MVHMESITTGQGTLGPVRKKIDLLKELSLVSSVQKS